MKIEPKSFCNPYILVSFAKAALISSLVFALLSTIPIHPIFSWNVSLFSLLLMGLENNPQAIILSLVATAALLAARGAIKSAEDIV